MITRQCHDLQELIDALEAIKSEHYERDADTIHTAGVVNVRTKAEVLSDQSVVYNLHIWVDK